MSAHVVIIANSSRRVTIKVTPGTVLNDVLSQACIKLGTDASKYSLKHGKNNLDLSIPFRLAGLSSGAKIDLIPRQASQSSMINVALQFVDGEGTRVTDKFPSSTTVWEILRKFEETNNLQLTERAAPNTTIQGSGRLFYEMPAIQANTQLSNFTDFQRTLGSLGYTSGSAVLRITFKVSDIPLEDALTQISTFSTRNTKASGSESTAQMDVDEDLIDLGESSKKNAAPSSVPNSGVSSNNIDQEGLNQHIEVNSVETAQELDMIDIGNRGVSIFNPTDSQIPEAARVEVKDEDLEMSISQAKQYQAHLKSATINKRLLTEAQKREKAQIEKDKRMAVESVMVRIRFPDGSMVQSKFAQADKATDLYEVVQKLLRYSKESFFLTLPGVSNSVISKDEQKLILDLGITAPTIINFYWSENVAPEIRRQDPLGDEFRQAAKKIPIPQAPAAVEDSDEDPSRAPKGAGSSSRKGGDSGSSGGKVPKWLKFGK